MCVGNNRRSPRLRRASIKVVSEVCAQGSDTHGTPVAHRALSTEGIRSGVPPFGSSHDVAQLDPGHLAVTTVRIALETPRESLRQCLLMNDSVRLEDGNDGNGHFC